MLQLDQQKCVTSSLQIGAGSFCRCGIPYTSRFRMIPCHHVACIACKKDAVNTGKCIECQAPLVDVETIHPNDQLLKCTINGCNKGFLNLPSLGVHTEKQHGTTVTSVQDFYKKHGDFVITNASKVISKTDQHDAFKPAGKRASQTIEIEAGSSAESESVEEDAVSDKKPRGTVARKSTPGKMPSAKDDDSDLEILM